jgi:hypothetical protein
MTQARAPGFWIIAAASALSAGLCLASIFLNGNIGLAFFIVGAALFLPTSIFLASRISGRPILAAADNAESKQRPIFSNALILMYGLFNLGGFLWSDAPGHDPLLHKIAGGSAVLMMGFGGFNLVAALIKRRATSFVSRN